MRTAREATWAGRIPKEPENEGTSTCDDLLKLTENIPHGRVSKDLLHCRSIVVDGVGGGKGERHLSAADGSQLNIRFITTQFTCVIKAV